MGSCPNRAQKRGRNRKRRQTVLSEKQRILFRKIRKMKMTDDLFLSAVLMENLELATLFIRTFTPHRNANAVSVDIQPPLRNLASKSSVSDVRIIDSEGNVYLIEMSESRDRLTAKRLVYVHSNAINASLPRGEEYAKLPGCWLIVISPSWASWMSGDVEMVGETFANGKPLTNRMKGMFGKSFVNLDYTGTDTDAGKLIHDLKEVNPDHMIYPQTADAVRSIKQDYQSKGVKFMSKFLERSEQIGLKRGLRLGVKRGKELGEDTMAAVAKIYIQMKPAGASDEEIADVVANQLNCSKEHALNRVRKLRA